ncbi:hypothetical protein IJI69_00415 [Candidatus Saccharibacteria bacterium]|nr:hypothetical protein [Candidatus Saccharibacteria bacterium]MBQ6127152.1 hypothetical protein [Candidatus Saccharibacteria bacterium]
MAFSRRWLTALGIDADKIEEIISAHIEVVDGLKKERDELSDKVSSLTETNKTLEADKKKLEAGQSDKYDELKKQFDDYKTEVLGKETRSEKEKAYAELLRTAGVSEKRINAILKVTDIDSLELDKDKKIKDEANKLTAIKAEWADFIEKKSVQGANTATPPQNTGGNVAKTREEIMKIKDTTERQKAWAEYLQNGDNT